MGGNNNNNGNSNGVQGRMGHKFHKEIEKIKDARLRNGKSKERIPTAKITNMIVRHKEAWKIISEDLINADEEEINEYG